MKKKNKALIILAIIFALAAILYIIATMYCHKLNIKVVEVKAGRAVEEGITADSILKIYDDIKIEFVENSNSAEYTYKDLGIKPELSDEQLNYIENNFIINIDKIEPTYNSDGLSDSIKFLNDNRQEYAYANLEKSDTEFTVTEQSDGNLLDIDKLSNDIKSELDGTDKIFDLTKYHTEKDSTKPTYEELSEKAEKANGTCIEYTNGYKIQLLDYIDYFSVVDNEIVLDTDKLNELKDTIDNTIEKELIEYDTVGKAMDFTTTSGKQIKVSGGTWGNIFSSDNETEYIVDKLAKFESEGNRKPIYSQEMNSKIGNTYIEISIQDQHVWHYVNGKLCCESACVTGKLDEEHATPTGVYYILERKNGKTLTPKGATSGTWVDKWMRVTWSGVGLHDASWRGAFGGNIYKTNGSHGCINLPRNYAYSLYDEINTGYCVVIY